AYITALLWSSPNANSNRDEFLDGFTFEDFTDNARDQAIKDCNEFLEKAKTYIEDPNTPDMEQFGHDFALTRNNHGTGFWDRPEMYGNTQASELTEISKSFGEIILFVEDSKVDSM